MTRAVAVTVVDPSPLDLATGLDDLAVQLDDLTVLQAVAEPLLLVSGDVVLHEVALADLAQDPRASTMALVSRAGQHDLRIRAGRIVAVRTAVHAAVPVDATFAGALRVAQIDRSAVAVVARDLADVARTHGWTGEPLRLLLLGLVRREVVVGAVALDPWPWSPTRMRRCAHGWTCCRRVRCTPSDWPARPRARTGSPRRWCTDR